MAAMVVQATILGMEAIMGVVDLITMAIMEEADQITMATMEDQDTTLEEGEVVLTTTGTMEDLGTTLEAMATTAVVEVGTTQGAARVGMADQGATQDQRLTGKW